MAEGSDETELWLGSDWALPYKPVIDAAWKASSFADLPFQRILGKYLTTLRVPKDCDFDNEDANRGIEAANQLIQKLRKAARENFAIHPAAANPASAPHASPAADVEENVPLPSPAKKFWNSTTK